MDKVVFPAKRRHYSEFDWFFKIFKEGEGRSPHFWTKKSIHFILAIQKVHNNESSYLLVERFTLLADCHHIKS